MPGPLHVGRHTLALCKRLTQAVQDFRSGKNTYLIINMPFRHGKSDLVSRALPAFFLGSCADLQPNIIMSGYGSSLVKGFSANVQGIVESEPYQHVFPGLAIDPDKNATDEWRIKDSVSSVYAQGLGGSITGKGGNLIIIDDYCKNAEEADSQVQRDKTWESFKTDLATRTNAPAHIIIICATRWDKDDIVGRIYNEMEKDPSYPHYESLIFPAHKPGPDGWDTLFPEHYNADWYNFQRKNLGPYRAAALLDCDPQSAGTTIFRREWIETYNGKIDHSRMRKIILVDGAKSKKQTSDFTCIQAWGKNHDGRAYLLDMVHDRLNLAEKIDALFKMVESLGGPRAITMVFWEQVGPMSDVEALKIEMTRRLYHFSVRELRHNTNKDFRIKRLVVPLSKGEMVFPDRLVKTRLVPSFGGRPPEVKAYDPIHELIEDELVPYTGTQDSIPHDDGLDCMADLTDEEVMRVFTPPAGLGRGDAETTNWASDSRRRMFR